MNETEKNRVCAIRGKYAIVSIIKHPFTLLWLKDRDRYGKEGYWTQYKHQAKAFSSINEARCICSGIKYNNPHIRKIY